MHRLRHVSSHHSFLYLWVVGALIVLGGLVYSYIGTHPDGIIDGQHEGDVRITVAQFGNHLNSVSLLTPDAADQIRNAYGPYVSEELLAAWVANPEVAPGRTTSSPWPDHIEVDDVSLNDVGAYDVTGRIMLVSSTGDAGSIPVSLTVAGTDGGYLITRYEQYASDSAPSDPIHVTAALGEHVSAYGVLLTPMDIVEDSRCPVDVACVQAGQLRVNVMLSSAMGTSTMPFTLASAEPVTTETASLWLSESTPEPLASDPASESEYLFTFRIEPR